MSQLSCNSLSDLSDLDLFNAIYDLDRAFAEEDHKHTLAGKFESLKDHVSSAWNSLKKFLKGNKEDIGIVAVELSPVIGIALLCAGASYLHHRNEVAKTRAKVAIKRLKDFYSKSVEGTLTSKDETEICKILKELKIDVSHMNSSDLKMYLKQLKDTNFKILRH